jgi:hypothetical protein
LASDGGAPGVLASRARQLLRPGLALLPEAIDSALSETVESYQKMHYDEVRSHVKRALEEALAQRLL